VNTAIENAAEDDEAAAVVRGHLARLERCMAAALRHARDTGEVRASVDPAGSAKALVASCQGLMVVGKANPDATMLRAIVDNAFAVLV
jgi:TetR/AcrR family transcriptional repressor of nem operon